MKPCECVKLPMENVDSRKEATGTGSEKLQNLRVRHKKRKKMRLKKSGLSQRREIRRGTDKKENLEEKINPKG